MSNNYVTLVVNGGTPVRLADQRGAPYPTTGTGSLVFAEDAVLTNPTLNGFTIDPSFPITVTTLTVLGDLTAASGVILDGNTSGSTRLIAPAVAAGIITLPSNTTVLVGTDTTNTLTNKTMSGASNTFQLIPVTALNSGTSASATTFWRGDGTWSVASGAGVSLTVGTTLITGGTTGRVLYDNAGVLGEMTNTGTGTVNVLQTSPTLTTPVFTTSGAINGAVATNRTLTFNTSGLARWQLLTDNTAEGGANAGSDFSYNAYTDAGAYLSTPIFVTRATGTVTLGAALRYGGVTLNAAVTGTGNMVLSAAPTLTGALTYGGVTLAAAVTGTGNMVLSAGATLTGTTTVATLTVGTLTTGPGTLSNLVMRVQTFTASGTYTPNANMVYCEIECWGGGGGGGGTQPAGTASAGTGGGGGGAGSYSKKISSKATIGASQAATIGAAGTAGAAGTNNGGAGGDTSIGALCVGKGGSGGTGQTTTGNTTAPGGLGGVAGTGDVTTTGAPGGSGYSMANAGSTMAGYGGSSSVGGGALQVGGNATSQAGNAGTGRASGGGGAYAPNGGTNQAGGAGTAGYIVITEFCTA